MAQDGKQRDLTPNLKSQPGLHLLAYQADGDRPEAPYLPSCANQSTPMIESHANCEE